MFKVTSVFVILAVVVLCTGAPPSPVNDGNMKVIGGSDADQKNAIFQGKLRIWNSFQCGGSIISRNTVVTAAHCVDGMSASSATFVVGSSDLNSGVTYNVDEIIIHADYSYWLLTNDIALLIFRGANAIVYSDVVGPISIQTEYTGGDVPCTLTGWGSTQLGGGAALNLQTIDLRTITTLECQQMWGSQVYETQICTLTKRGEGACHGDSGGPLIAYGKLIGIVSWGSPCANAMPDVYTRVGSYEGWIQDNAVF